MIRLRRRVDLGVKPGESDPARMLAIVLLGLALLGLAGLVAAGWLW